MSDNSKIEWTDATWNPITGCSVTSPGCTNCYAMGLAGTRLASHESRAGLTRKVNGKHVWTGEVRLNANWLEQPLRWKRPRTIFVCAHGDLFHENVPDEWIDHVFAVMALCPQHRFQVLTKRSDRMREYFSDEHLQRRIRGVIAFEFITYAQERECHVTLGDGGGLRWPLPNVWLGVSVEDQTRANERIPDLLATPAAVRFLSCEPLLGPVDLSRVRPEGSTWLDCCAGREHVWPAIVECETIDWVICGGESGNGARPMHPDWARSLRDQCADADVPFFFKQWGAWAPIGKLYDDDGDTDETIAAEQVLIDATSLKDGWANPDRARLIDADGFNWANECAQPPSDVIVIKRVGKKAAGRLLDGVEHSGMPNHG